LYLHRLHRGSHRGLTLRRLLLQLVVVRSSAKKSARPDSADRIHVGVLHHAKTRRQKRVLARGFLVFFARPHCLNVGEQLRINTAEWTSHYFAL